MADLYILGQNNSPSRGGNQSTMRVRGTRDGMIGIAEWLMMLNHEGRIFVASDADENDRVTGQTSYAATTPTFLLKVPSGTTAVPIGVSLGQSGTAAGGDISVVLSFDSADRYSTGGTSESIRSLRTDQPVTPGCTLYSGATAAAATNARTLLSVGEVPAVAGANTATRSDSFLNFAAYRDFYPPVLIGPAAFLVFTYASTPGPMWEWAITWAELPSTMFT